MTVWPLGGWYAFGAWLGAVVFDSGRASWHIFTIGNLLALLADAAGQFRWLFVKFAPWDCRRFRLTNRRVIIEKGLQR